MSKCICGLDHTKLIPDTFEDAPIVYAAFSKKAACHACGASGTKDSSFFIDPLLHDKDCKYMKFLAREGYMKRYKLKMFAVSPQAAGKPFLGLNEPIVDHFEPRMVEDPEGEWVKYEDVKGILQYKDQLKGYTLAGSIPKCNCKEFMDLYEGRSGTHHRSWICPAHGYKKI